MHSFSFGEIALVFGIVIILFGGSRLASIGKSLGEGISNFKKGLNANEAELKNQTQQTTFSSTSNSAYTPPQMASSNESVKKANAQVIDIEQKEVV